MESNETGMNANHENMSESSATAGDQPLEYYEQIIARGLQNKHDVAGALLAIHRRRLYRKDYGSFEAYLLKRWQMSRARGYQLLHFARFKVSTMVDTAGPKNERQARRLAADGKPRPREDDDPMEWAMDCVVEAFRELDPSERPELISSLRDLLEELERELNAAAQCPARRADSRPAENDHL